MAPLHGGICHQPFHFLVIIVLRHSERLALGQWVTYIRTLPNLLCVSVGHIQNGKIYFDSSNIISKLGIQKQNRNSCLAKNAVPTAK